MSKGFEGLLADQTNPTTVTIRELLIKAQACEDWAHELLEAQIGVDANPDGFDPGQLFLSLNEDDQVILDVDLRDSYDESAESILQDHGEALLALGVDLVQVERNETVLLTALNRSSDSST